MARFTGLGHGTLYDGFRLVECADIRCVAACFDNPKVQRQVRKRLQIQ